MQSDDCNVVLCIVRELLNLYLIIKRVAFGFRTCATSVPLCAQVCNIYIERFLAKNLSDACTHATNSRHRT